MCRHFIMVILYGGESEGAMTNSSELSTVLGSGNREAPVGFYWMHITRFAGPARGGYA